MKKHIYILFIISVLISSCGLLPKPDKFELDKHSPAPIEGLKLSDYDLVEVTADNEFILYDGGIASIKRPSITTSQVDFVVTLRQGNGLRFMSRTDTKKYKIQPGITFDWTMQGSSVYSNGVLLAKTDSIKASLNVPSKIFFHQDGDFFSIAVGCDTVIKARTNLPGSEFMIIESKNSQALISAVNMDNLFGFERETVLEVNEDEGRIKEERVIQGGNNPK